MPSIDSLRSTIQQQQTAAESKRKLAEDLLRTADQHEASGDEARAKLDRESAERYLRDLEEIEKTIAGYEADIRNREQKAAEIDKKIADLRQRFEREFKGLEDEKESVKAAILFRNDNIEAARRAIKDKRLDDKEEQLQKDLKRDVDKLEHEKSSLIH